MSSASIKTEEVILENVEYNSAEELDDELQLQLEDSGGEYVQYQNEQQLSTQRHRQQSSNISGGGDVDGDGDAMADAKNSSNSTGGSTSNNKNALESEKRMRREIANSNERRRMQSINAGFQNLRSLLPRHEGEKLSKAAILQQTSQYICELENQKTQLLAQNSQLKRQLGQHESTTAGDSAAVPAPGTAANNAGEQNASSGVAIKKRKLTDNVIISSNLQAISDSSDEGLGSMSPEPMTLLNAAAAAAAANTKQLAQQALLIAAQQKSSVAAKELLEMKRKLEKESRLRNMLEEELQAIKRQLYSVATAASQHQTGDDEEITPDDEEEHDVEHDNEHLEHHEHLHEHDQQQQHEHELLDHELHEHDEIEHHHQQQQHHHHQLHHHSTTTNTTTSGTYIPSEVIEHTDNLHLAVRDELVELPAGSVSYVEIDDMNGQRQVVVCSSIEELDESEAAAAAAEIISEEDNCAHEEVILSSNSSTESEQECCGSVNAAIVKAYAEGRTPSGAVLQPILQAAIKATPKVEVERINETTIMKVKTEKIEQPSGLTRSRQNLETIVEAIRHLEGDHLFGEVIQQQQQIKSQDAPLALTTKQQVVAAAAVAQRTTTLAELRPFLQLKGGQKQLTIVSSSGTGGSVTLTHQQLAAAAAAAAAAATVKKEAANGSSLSSSATVTPTAIFKVQTHGSGSGGGGSSSAAATTTTSSAPAATQQITITTSALKQCRPGVIVAKQLS